MTSQRRRRLKNVEKEKRVRTGLRVLLMVLIPGPALIVDDLEVMELSLVQNSGEAGRGTVNVFEAGDDSMDERDVMPCRSTAESKLEPVYELRLWTYIPILAL
jgi:hypothetical protein